MSRAALHSFALGALPMGALMLGITHLDGGWGRVVCLGLMIATLVLSCRAAPIGFNAYAGAGVLAAFGVWMASGGVIGIVDAINHHGPIQTYSEARGEHWETESQYKRGLYGNAFVMLVFGAGAIALGIVGVKWDRQTHAEQAGEQIE